MRYWGTIAGDDEVLDCTPYRECNMDILFWKKYAMDTWQYDFCDIKEYLIELEKDYDV